MNQIDLHHRHAVVTGGAQGIGHSIASRLLSSGASVSLWDRDGELLSVALKKLGERGEVSAETVDVSETSSVAVATAATVENHGKIDILVANAGIAGPNHATWEYPINIWKQVIDINLVGVFLCCHAIVPHMLHQGYGRIVNVASIAGKEGNPNASAYSASKAGVIALTKSLGKETANWNIAVNCITPAAARTRLFDQMTGERAAIAQDSGAGEAWILQSVRGPAERARVNELVVVVFVRWFRAILRGQLKRQLQGGEQSQSNDTCPCFGIHLFLRVVFCVASRN